MTTRGKLCMFARRSFYRPFCCAAPAGAITAARLLFLGSLGSGYFYHFNEVPLALSTNTKAAHKHTKSVFKHALLSRRLLLILTPARSFVAADQRKAELKQAPDDAHVSHPWHRRVFIILPCIPLFLHFFLLSAPLSENVSPPQT